MLPRALRRSCVRMHTRTDHDRVDECAVGPALLQGGQEAAVVPAREGGGAGFVWGPVAGWGGGLVG